MSSSEYVRTESADGAYLHINDGSSTMTFPNPTDPTGVEWTLRYGNPTRETHLIAASYIAAYRQLVAEDAQRRRNLKVSLLRHALNRWDRERQRQGVE